MNNLIFQLLSNMMSANQPTQKTQAAQQQNPATSNYPPEASTTQNTPQQNNPFASIIGTSNGDNPMISLLSALLSKSGSPISNIMQQEKKEGSRPSPKEEILL